MVILTSLCLMEIGCHGRSVGQVESRLELIDSLTATRPDSALLGLESMRDEPMSRRERIFFELLHGKATVLARLPYTADSVMRQVVDYYDLHGDIARQAEARYLLACAFFDSNQPSHAMRQLKHLSLISDTNTSPSHLTLMRDAHTMLARLYEGHSAWDEAWGEDSLAEQLALSCHDTLHAIGCRKNMCRILFHRQLYEQCISASWRIFEECHAQGCPDHGLEFLVLIIESFLNSHRHREAAECLRHYENFLSLHPEARSPRAEAALSVCQARILHETGAADSAAVILAEAGDLGRSIYEAATYRTTLPEEALADEALDEADVTSHARRPILTWTIVFLLVATLAWTARLALRRKRGMRIQAENASTLHSQIGQLKTKNDYLETALSGITQQDRRDEYLASEAVQSFHRHLRSPRAFPLDAGKWKALRDETERCFPTFRERMHSGRPISDTEYTLCLLTKAGFSVKQINLLMGKEDYASTTRRRLLRKIFAEEGTPADFDRRIQAIV